MSKINKHRKSTKARTDSWLAQKSDVVLKQHYFLKQFRKIFWNSSHQIMFCVIKSIQVDIKVLDHDQNQIKLISRFMMSVALRHSDVNRLSLITNKKWKMIMKMNNEIEWKEWLFILFQIESSREIKFEIIIKMIMMFLTQNSF